jgi:UMF1 family MFS transporter
VIDSTSPLLPHNEQGVERPLIAVSLDDMQLSTKISSYGIGIGYSAALVVQMLSIIILKATDANLWSLRLILFMIGLWWFCFTIPAAMYLRPRPGPPLSYGKSGDKQTWVGYVTYSWKNLGKTVVRARRLKDVLLFLAAWFMISDSVATVSGTAILFAKTTLGMEASALALINVTVTVSGIIGAFTWSKISRMMSLTPSQTILSCIFIFELIPLYGLLGYVPAIRRFGTFGLQQPWEMYPLGAVYGLVLGGLGAYCRALYGELIPPGSEAAFYALYAITDKGSSVFGPAIVGAITDATGDIRPAFWFLAVLIGLPIPLMFLVDVERGKREGAALARETMAIAEPENDGENESNDNDDGLETPRDEFRRLLE